MRPILWALTGWIAMLACQTCYGQQTAEGQVPAPTFRVATHLVLVDAVVTDKDGKPILGLKPQDFLVQESGKAQKISIFVTPEEKRRESPAAALPPGIYSNRPQYRTPGGPIAVLLLDAANTQFKDQAYARLQMLKFVREHHQPGQHMAVLTLTDSLRVLQDFTTDPQLLYDALNGFLPREGPFTTAQNTSSSVPVTADVSPARAIPVNESPRGGGGGGAAAIAAVLQQELRDFSQAGTAYNLERRTEITFQALNALARSLGGLPGRKTVIWVTGDLPFTLQPQNRVMTEAELAENLPSMNTRRAVEHASGNYAATARESFADQIRETDARLSAAQIAIYPVDARGLTTSTNQDAQDVMREMAADTGGRAYINQNEIKYGVERALGDVSATYTLGYYPDNRKWDGKYRPIKLKLDRPGTQLQYRRGYFAIDPAQTKGYKPGSDVAAAIAGAVPATQVAFSARLQPANNGKLGIDFLVDTSTIYADEDSNGKKLNVSFYLAMFSREGRILGSESQKVERVFDRSSYEQIMQHGMLLHMEVAPPAGAAQLRLAVQDGRTGLVGSVDAPIKSQ